MDLPSAAVMASCSLRRAAAVGRGMMTSRCKMRKRTVGRRREEQRPLRAEVEEEGKTRFQPYLEPQR